MSAAFQSREMRSIFRFYRWSSGITRSEKLLKSGKPVRRAHKTPLGLMMDEGVEPRDEDTRRSSVTSMPEATVPGSPSGVLTMLHSIGHR